MGDEAVAAAAAAHDPLALALLAVLTLATVVQMLLRRTNGKHAPKPGFTDEEAGAMKEKIATLEREVKGFRDWRHDDYVHDMTKLATQFVPRNEIMLMHKESGDDREKIWSAVEHLRQELRDRR